MPKRKENSLSKKVEKLSLLSLLAGVPASWIIPSILSLSEDFKDGQQLALRLTGLCLIAFITLFVGSCLIKIIEDYKVKQKSC